MAKLTEAELRAARLALAREFDLDRHIAFRVEELFCDSVARVFINWARALDALDPEVWHFRGRLFYPVDGRQVGGDQSYDASLRRKWERRAEIYCRYHHRLIRHVVDWLWEAAQENHHWLHNRDSHGRPKKLLKASTIEDLAREADKSLLRRLDQDRSEIAASSRLELTGDDEQILLDLGAGYCLVRLWTPQALDQESVALKHCVGHGAYDHLIATGRSEIYSVRDQTGTPQATIEIVTEGQKRLMTQFRGKLNQQPEPHVQELVFAALPELGWTEPYSERFSDVAPVQPRP